MNKSERYTSKYLNKGKHIILEAADAEALSLKNEMSKYCFSNLFLLLSDSHFANNYKIFRSKYLSAWEVQAIFKDVICFYKIQLCPKCGHIHHDNRKSQEEFICLKCGYSDNADINAANNILRRFTSDVLNENLHNKDCFGRLQPKKLKKRKIKQILQEY